MNRHKMKSIRALSAAAAIAGLAWAYAPTAAAQPQAAPPTASQAAPASAPMQPLPPGARAAIASAQDELLIRRLVTQSLIALQQANETGNYAVFHALTAPEFRSKNSVSRLADTFRPLRDARVDLGAIVNGPAQLAPAPYIDAQNRMFVQGVLATGADVVAFALQFVAVDGVWRLQEIALGDARPPQR